MATSLHKRKRAARVRREGGTQEQAANAIKVHPDTVRRWEREDAEFQALMHGTGILRAGPLRAQDTPDTPEETSSETSTLWVQSAPEPAVLGSLAVREATLCRVFFCPPDAVSAVRADLEAHRLPSLPNTRTATLHASALQALQDADELRTVCRLFCTPLRESFREWCSLWKFRAGETKDTRTLAILWPGQSMLADALCEHAHTYLLKARKLGATEISLAFAAYTLRIRDQNANVGLFSFRERAANDLLAKVRFGLENLPDYLRLPYAKDTTMKTLDFDAGTDDVRSIQSFPTSKSPSIDLTFSHAVLDEFAHWPHIERQFAALEPTFSAPGASSELLTTGVGPESWSADYWRMCQDGQALHTPIFIPADARPDRDAAWLEAKKKSMTRDAFKQEYAMSPEDALAGIGEYVFNGEDIDASNVQTLATTPGKKWKCPRCPGWRTTQMYDRCPRCGAKAVPTTILLGWDVAGAGENADASVGTALDIGDTEGVAICEQRRFVGLPFTQLQREIEKMAFMYFPAKTVIEMNGMGAAVFGHLELPPHRKLEFWQTERSKQKTIGDVQMALESHTLLFDHEQNEQLVKELRGYKTPDTYCQTDCVMSLAVTLGKAGEAFVRPGRVLAVIQADAYG